MADVNTPEGIEERKRILAASTDRMELESAATQLATADDPAALEALGPFLTDAAFLERLDEVNDLSQKVLHLSQVLLALTRFASPEIVPLCLKIVNDPAFRSDPERKVFVLQALAEGGPMDAETVEVFRLANGEGYFATSASLLARNSSPLAMALLLSMMLDEGETIEYRVDLLHSALIPVRDRIPIIEFAGRLLAGNAPSEVLIAAIESIYHYRPDWRRGHPGPPPPWRKASVEVLKYLVNMAAFLKKSVTIPEALQAPMDRTVAMAQALLARRGG